jgi:hypothetical protein
MPQDKTRPRIRLSEAILLATLICVSLGWWCDRRILIVRHEQELGAELELREQELRTELIRQEQKLVTELKRHEQKLAEAERQKLASDAHLKQVLLAVQGEAQRYRAIIQSMLTVMRDLKYAVPPYPEDKLYKPTYPMKLPNSMLAKEADTVIRRAETELEPGQ